MLPEVRGIVPQRPDYFLAHRPTQPKREVADYVESQGVLVPQRFSGLPEALGSGKPFIVRSEHPQDYDGASGVLESLLVSPERILTARSRLDSGVFGGDQRPGKDNEEVERLVVGIGQISQEDLEARFTQATYSNAAEYCRYTGISLKDFMAQASYSYWEAIPGVNRAVVADTAIKGRYHIFSDYEHSGMAPVKGESKQNYIIVEDGKIIVGTSRDLQEDGIETIQGLIEAYERIRNLDRFPSDNCPIVEIQSSGASQYFLQYLRLRDFKASEFVLDRNPGDGEIVLGLVRGVTPPEGAEFSVTYIGPFGSNEVPQTEATLNKSLRPMFIETIAKNLKAEVIWVDDQSEIYSLGGSHVPRSMLFKPEMSLICTYKDSLRLLGRQSGYPEVEEDSGRNTFRVRIVSDGRKAYLKRTA